MGQRIDLPILTGVTDYRHITPTDIAQFIRLEQCERYLRLRLHSRALGAGFMRAYGVVPQSIPPLLTRSGERFEDRIERVVGTHLRTVNLAQESAGAADRGEDNARLIAETRALSPGETVVLFQPRLRAEVDGWHMRGDVDILRLERDAHGALHVLIADMKSSTTSRVEHRLQVAFYYEMLAALYAREGIACAGIDMAILYRGGAQVRRQATRSVPPGHAWPQATGRGDRRQNGLPSSAFRLPPSASYPVQDGGDVSLEEAHECERQRKAAEEYFGVPDALLDIVADPDSYRGAIRDLVTDPLSTAARVAKTPFASLPYHLTYKCDGCLYNEFCMKWSAEHDDLSLLPHLAAQDKAALLAAGVATTRDLALLKEFPRPGPASGARGCDLVAAPGKEDVVGRLAATPPVGARLEELVHRARRYRQWKKDATEALSYIPSKGYGSLPYTDAGHNPNLVRVYVDAQHDYLHDRIYMLGALVVACEGGVEHPQRRRSIVHLTEGPPDTAEHEQQLFMRWIDETLRAIVELAAPDENGARRAPLHLVFYNSFEQRLLLEGLGRHATAIFGVTPLYDFVTQLAAFDSPVATFLDREIRELKNYPMVCQSLQAVAAYLRFDWNTPERYREIFRVRLFDFWGKLEPPDGHDTTASPWITSRARFNSQIPLEYAYAAWGELAAPTAGRHDDFASYRGATPALLAGFHRRRLEALEHITHDFLGNKQTEKRAFDLPTLTAFAERAATLAEALDEFVTIERHVELSDWKAKRLAPPERRVLSGDTLLVRYVEADQEPEVAARNRENVRRARLDEEYRAAYRAAHPGATQVRLPKEQREESAWSQDGMRFRLRLECAGVDCALDEALALSELKEGDRVVLNPRTTVDSRLPVAEQTPFTPTPRQMLYGVRADIARIVVARDDAGRAVACHVEITMAPATSVKASRGFVFGGRREPLVDGTVYTLDPDPNDWYGYFCTRVTEGLCAGQPNTLYERLDRPEGARVTWPVAAAEGQARFLAGLDALHAVGALPSFEPSKRDYIGARGDAPILLVQGPPGTGKSYTTAFAVLARLQGAMAAGLDYRVIISCKTHAATDVLLGKLADAQRRLRACRDIHPAIVAEYLDSGLLDLPLFRMQPRDALPDGVTLLYRDSERSPDHPRAVDAVMQHRWCVVAAPPAGIYRMIKDRWPDSLFGHALCDGLVLDEASQMNLPEAMMAALLLKPDGHLIVVGDHRQMPPIVKHEWGTEPRRTFQEFRTYESLFLTLRALEPPMIKFSESFRLHADMAAFLREQIYAQDGIPYHSHKRLVLPAFEHHDPFVAAVLAPAHALVVVVHDEAQSQQRNAFEQALIAPLLEALADAATYHLGPEHGLGVVVPHRAQRAALQEALPSLTRQDPQSGTAGRSAVDTVERFQGGEREVILVSATESDPQYVLASTEFLLDPRRLTVALSRAERKMILVASRSVFNVFSADEETFTNSQLWKNLLRRTCTVRLWEGERGGRRVVVWGNGPTTPAEDHA